jgi:DNA-binding ferritin-like protein
MSINARTQIYLSDRQRRALKLLSAASDQSVSDLVRRAMDRLLSDELASDDWGERLDALAERVRAQVPEATTAEIAEAVRCSRLKRKIPA